MIYHIHPQGVCSQEMELEIDEQGIVTRMEVYGGCSGNLQGISKLVAGMRAEDVIEKLGGIRCGWKDTSCPDQLAKGLKKILKKRAEAVSAEAV